MDPWFEFRGWSLCTWQVLLAEKFGSFLTVGILFNFISILIGQFLAMSNFFLNALFSLAEGTFEILKERIELIKVQFFKIVKKRNEWNGKILERRNSRTIELGITSCFRYVTVKSTTWLFPNFFSKKAKILLNDILLIVNLETKLTWKRVNYLGNKVPFPNYRLCFHFIKSDVSKLTCVSNLIMTFPI